MDPRSRAIISRIVEPTGGPASALPAGASTSMTLEQIIAPTGRYSGMERRVQGALVMEVIAPPPAQ